MLQAKTNGYKRPQNRIAKSELEQSKSTAFDIQVLLNSLLGYEAAVRNNGINFGSGRFKMLTDTECEYLKAELIADYISLSTNDAGNIDGYNDAELTSFCSRICDMQVPSNELMGTYLAAINVVHEQQPANDIPRFNEAIRRTMIRVLQKCTVMMANKAEITENGAKSANSYKVAVISI